jgi:hypothetical protein
MKASPGSLDALLDVRRDYESPPLHLWQPESNGDIPIIIDAQGEWYHDGGKIERESLVRLFASILRREDDGDYYLVTPHEKWRIEVAQHPLVITDISTVDAVDGKVLEACLNTGKHLAISEQYPLYLDEAAGGVAAMRLPHGLTALCSRAAWYRLVDMADATTGAAILRSGSYELRLPLD